MSGTPVVVTQAAGASVVLCEPSFGTVVPVHSPDAIAAAITSLAGSNALTGQARSDRARLARARLSADAGARYLLDIVRWSEGHSVRPAPYTRNQQ